MKEADKNASNALNGIMGYLHDKRIIGDKTDALAGSGLNRDKACLPLANHLY
ncbi:hypothetical protein [Methylomarinum vadi]|uniref:hypothetical protein n=1 Tax=Methylomarinum vadi TaxID=438855 RepID=UPI00136472CD|nr:hypothetical protein [Methylomarinum vadi]